MPYNCLLCRDEGQDGEIISEKFGIFLDFETDTVTPDVTNQLHVQLGVAISKAEEMMVSFGEYGDGGKQIICDLTTNPSEECLSCCSRRQDLCYQVCEIALVTCQAMCAAAAGGGTQRGIIS